MSELMKRKEFKLDSNVIDRIYLSMCVCIYMVPLLYSYEVLKNISYGYMYALVAVTKGFLR